MPTGCDIYFLDILCNRSVDTVEIYVFMIFAPIIDALNCPSLNFLFYFK